MGGLLLRLVIIIQIVLRFDVDSIRILPRPPWRPTPFPIPVPPIDDCGLFQIIGNGNEFRPISLISVSVQSTVIHVAAQTEVTQLYSNAEQKPIETIYFFPLDPNGAVVHFHAELDGRIINAVSKPSEEARDQYNKAVEAKQTAFLGEQNQADIFKVRIGFLKPGSLAKIVLRFVSEVKNEKNSNGLRFYIPTTVAPRYIPRKATDEQSKDLSKMTFTSGSSRPMTIKVTVRIQGAIQSIESPTHKINTVFGQANKSSIWSSAEIQLESRVTEMDRDFVLLITPTQVHKPRVYVEKLESSTAMMVHLIPSFKLKDQKSELIFVLDRSGSMQGQSIELARKALQLFLHSIPDDCYFNIVGFGSTFSFLFNESVKYDDSSLLKAKAHARALGADMGGTEILQPLLEVYSKKLVPGYLRQIFVLTDGEVSNSDQVVGVTRMNAHESRVFALGIGDGASHYLVEGIAKAGGGTSAFVTYNEPVDAKVLQQLKDALQPSLSNVKVTWDGLSLQSKEADAINNNAIPPTANVNVNPAIPVNTEKTLMGYGKPIVDDSSLGKSHPTEIVKAIESQPKLVNSFRQSPQKIPPIFDGSQLVIVGLFEGPHRNDVTGVTIQADSPDGPLKINVPVTGDENSYDDQGGNQILHLLAAVKLIRELELNVNEVGQRKEFSSVASSSQDVQEEEQIKREIVQLATKFGLASKFTSFVAVDNSTDKNIPDSWVMQTRYIPSKIAHGWHGGAPMMMANFAAAPARPHSFSKKSSHTFHAMSGALMMPMMQQTSSAAFGDADEAPSTARVVLDPVDALVDLQSFDGSFSLDEKFAKAIQSKLDTLKKVMMNKKLDPKVWATALAITFMEKKLSGQKESWELVAEKARKWLKKKDPTNFQTLLQDAQKIV